MRATRVSEFGPPDVLELVEIDDPTPGAGEVLVDIRATHVVWVDTAIRSGAGRDWFPLRPPYVPGKGVAGTVAAAGPDLPASWPGRRVVAHTGLSGGYADRVVVPVEQVVPVPERVSLEAAAALVHDATTALALFDALRVGPDDAVLVVGASGGLGLVSAQLARRRARDVLALARDQAKIARIRDATGVRVVDTERPDWLAEARASLPRGADVVLDNVGGPLGAAAVELLADGGRWSSHGTPGGSFTAIEAAEAARRGITLLGIGDAQFDTPRRMELIAAGLDAAARGELTPVIGQTFPLAKAADVHAAVEARTVFGSTLLVG
jgi:NADPH:quinone reductase